MIRDKGCQMCAVVDAVIGGHDDGQNGPTAGWTVDGDHLVANAAEPAIATSGCRMIGVPAMSRRNQSS